MVLDDKRTFDSGLNFPEAFALRVIGDNRDDFETFVLAIIQQHLPDLGREQVTTRSSRDGHYLAVTVMVVPQSKEHLDTIYKELAKHERILMVL